MALSIVLEGWIILAIHQEGLLRLGKPFTMPGAMFWVPLSQGFRHISLMLWDLDVFIPFTMPLFSLLDCVWISFLEQTKWLKTTEVYSLRVLETTSQNQRLSRTASSGVSSEESLTSPLPFSGGCKCPGLLLPGRVQQIPVLLSLHGFLFSASSVQSFDFL